MKSVSKFFVIVTLLLSIFIVSPVDADQLMSKRVPAEWEPQEAIWLQWPGRWEKVYEPAFAQMASIIPRYEKLHIICHTKTICNQARTEIEAAGGEPMHANITWHEIPNDSAWMRDNGPVYIVEDGKMRIQNCNSMPGAAPLVMISRMAMTTVCPHRLVNI